MKKEEGWITRKAFSVKYRPSPVPSRGLEISLILKFNCSKSVTFLKMKKFVNERYYYEFTGQDQKSEDEEEILAMVIDEDQDSIDEKIEKNRRCF